MDNDLGYTADKRDLGALIGTLVPPPTSDRALALLERWTKYERTLHPEYGDPIFNLKVGDGLDIVAVTKPHKDRVPVLDDDGEQLMVPKQVDGKPVLTKDGEPVLVPATTLVQRHALVVRSFSHKEPVLDRETREQRTDKDGEPIFRYRYDIVGLIPIASPEAAIGRIQDIRAEMEAADARDIDGFGDGLAEQDSLDRLDADDEVGF